MLISSVEDNEKKYKLKRDLVFCVTMKFQIYN